MAGGAAWLDVGCGTGALSQTVLRETDPAVVVGVDPSLGLLVHARGRLAGDAWFAAADARRLPAGGARFDAVVSGLVLNFVPGGRLRLGLRRPHGADPHFWDAAAAVDPAAVELDEGRRFGLCQPEPLARLFQAAGLDGVDVRSIEVPTRFRDFDDYWSPFLGGQGPAPAYAMSLDGPRRATLREQLRRRLPVAGDGSIPLVARAWAVAGASTRRPHRASCLDSVSR